MSDLIPKPVNSAANLSNTNSNIAITNRLANAQAAVNVVVTQITPKEVVLTNPSNTQSVNISKAQFAGAEQLKLNQRYTLSAYSTSNPSTSEPTSTLSSGNKASATVAYILTPYRPGNTTTSANTNTAPTLAVIDKKQSDSVLSVINKELLAQGIISKEQAAQTGSQTLNAKILSIQGNQITLAFPAVKGALNTQAKINLPNQVVQLLNTGQALNINYKLANDRVQVLSVSLPSQTGTFTNTESTLQQLFAKLSKTTLSKIQLPRELFTRELVSANQNIGKEVQRSANVIDKDFVLNAKLLSLLPSSLGKDISKALADVLAGSSGKEISLSNALLKGVEARIVQGANQLSISLRNSNTSVTLNHKQASLLLKESSGLEVKQSSSDGTSSARNSDNRSVNSRLGNNASINSSILQSSAPNSQHAMYQQLNLIANKSPSNEIYSPSAIIANAKANNLNNKAINKGDNNDFVTTTKSSQQPTISEQANSTQTVSSQSILKQLSSQLTQAQFSQKTASDMQLHISQLAKQILPKTQAQTQVFSDLINTLSDLRDVSAPLKTVLNSVKDSILKSDNQMGLNDHASLKQLLSSTINPAPLNALASNAQTGFLNALVTLLQVALASRLQKQSNDYASKVQQAIPDIVKKLIPNISPSQGARLAQEFNQFDSKHLLSTDIAKLLANHQQHKLTSLDSSIQGQDSLYYSLPNIFNKQGKDIELLIKHEYQQKDEDKEHSDAEKQWALTMKFEIGEKGELLAKTKLKGSQIDLQIYTSNELLKGEVLTHLPLLKTRLANLGIELLNRQCQLGKIPDSLNERHFQVYQTNA